MAVKENEVFSFLGVYAFITMPECGDIVIFDILPLEVIFDILPLELKRDLISP